MNKQKDDEYYMRLALKEAQKAYNQWEVPVGAVLVYEDKVLARAHNDREKKERITGHAEMMVLDKASRKLHFWRLEDTTLYVTLEPCPMCMGAMLQTRVKRVVYGAKEYKFGACGSVVNLNECSFTHHVELTGGVLEQECQNMLTSFFQELRKKKKEATKQENRQ